MTKEQLKKKLLKLNIVVDNEYLDKYIEIIFNNLNTKREKFKTQRHHIIPRCYYKYNNLNTDNSLSNIVNLNYKDHILVHYYLYKRASAVWFRVCNYDAIRYVINTNRTKKCNDDIEQYIFNLDCDLSEEDKQYISQMRSDMTKGKNNPFYGKKHTEETKKKISLKLSNPSDEKREKLRKSHLGKKPTKETIEKRRNALILAHKDKNKFINVAQKVSETKRRNNSGNNRKNKIHVISTITKESHYIKKEDLEKYLSNNYILFVRKNLRPRKGKLMRQVYCFETNTVYDSCADAGRKLNLNYHSIFNVCEQKRKSCKNLHFEYRESKMSNINR